MMSANSMGCGSGFGISSIFRTCRIPGLDPAIIRGAAARLEMLIKSKPSKLCAWTMVPGLIGTTPWTRIMTIKGNDRLVTILGSGRPG